ncbi:alpha amylase C-terminal domain-containing protein, partial [Clostridium saudiense]|nr:alpha amylase C-terminal domain-containing protein [Clostridium saudiense]
FNTDRLEFGGSGQVMNDALIAEEIEMNNRPYSIKIKVPPMAATVLSINNIYKYK